MPGKVKVRVIAGRNLPVMDRSSDTTDAYVEVKLGSTTYKTDVCRKSLHPQWDSDWFRYEVDDSELQDEPLQIRLMDHDTYSANDAIGKVYVDLNPLLLPPSAATSFSSSTANQHHANPANSDSNHPNVQSGPGPAGGGVIMAGWLPVFDTMHGIRGEVNLVVKVELFSDFNKFRQSSCGVQFFCSGSIPEGHVVSRLQGLVGELVVEGDPEHQWIDKIRTPRASNEARQALFFKLSGELRRRIGLKAIELGANAVLGYQQSFDLEGETGIVVRGIGTAATLAKLQTPQHAPTLHSPSPSPSPSPAGQASNSANQGTLEHSVSSNSINRNSCPQATASPHSRRKNQFLFFPSTPGSSRRNMTSSVSQFGFSPGVSSSKTKSGSPKHQSASGYGVVRRCPSSLSLQKGYNTSNTSIADDSCKGYGKYRPNKLQDNDDLGVESDQKSKKKQGSNSERPTLVDRLKAVKLFPKSVHGKLSRLWSNSGGNSNVEVHGSPYRRSVSDSAGMGGSSASQFIKSDPIIDLEELGMEQILYDSSSEKDGALTMKPSSFPGTTFPTLVPVEINIQSPGETIAVFSDVINDGSYNISQNQPPLYNAESVITSCEIDRSLNKLQDIKETECPAAMLDFEGEKSQKLSSDLDSQSLSGEMEACKNISPRSLTCEHVCDCNSFKDSSDPASAEITSPISKNNRLNETLEIKSSEDKTHGITCEKKDIKQPTDSPLSGDASKICCQAKERLSGAPHYKNTIRSMLTVCHEPPIFKELKRKRTLSMQKSADNYDPSVFPLLAFDDVKQNRLVCAMKPAKSDSFISELKREPMIMEFSHTPLGGNRGMYGEDIIAQVCQLEELINERNSQSPRTRLHSRTIDDDEFDIESELKPPALEVSSWQEEEENERDGARSEMTYVDGHFYSNQSSSDEDDSSSCLSFLGDTKIDEDSIDYEQDSTATKNKCFLDTLAPTKLVKGCKKKRLSPCKRLPSVDRNPPLASKLLTTPKDKADKDASQYLKPSKTTKDKMLSHKNLIKDVHLKLLPIKSKKTVSDKTTNGNDNDGTQKFDPDSSCLDVGVSSGNSQVPKKDVCGPSSSSRNDLTNTYLEAKSPDVMRGDDQNLLPSETPPEAKKKISCDCVSIKSLISGSKDDNSLSQGNNNPTVEIMKTSKHDQGVESPSTSFRSPELCTGSAPLPHHASPPSSTSSTSTLQCLCRTPVPGSAVLEKQGSSPPSTAGCQAKKGSGSTTDSHPCLHRRSSDSDLSVTPKDVCELPFTSMPHQTPKVYQSNECPGIPSGTSSISGSSGGICGSSRDSTGYTSQWCHQSGSYPAGGYGCHPYHAHGPHWGPHHLPHLHHPLMGRVPGTGTNSGIAPDPLDMAEYPFLTMTSYPPGFILHLAGTVSARSVKLLSSGGDGGGGGSGGEEETWEQRDAWWTEVRMEIRSHARALACDVVIAYSEKTSICDDVCVLSASGTAAVINPNYFYHGVGPEDGLRGIGNSHQCQSAHRELMTSSLDRTDFEKDKGVTLVASTNRTRNPSESREIGEEKAAAGSIGGMASSTSPPHNTLPPQSSSSQNCSGALHLPSCSVCHIPYGPSTVPFRISMAKCALCRRGCVPDVLLATCEPPEGLATIGVGSLIQAYASRGRRGEGGYGGGGSGGGGGIGGGGVVGVGVGGGGSSRGEASAKDISDGLPFLEYDLHRALANKLRLCGMNAVFGLKVEVKVGEKLLVAIATGTGVLVSALPKPTAPCIRPQSIHQGGQVSGSQAALADTLQKNLEETVKRCRETYLLDPPKENSWANGTGRGGNSDTDDSGEDEHQHSLPQLDLSAGNKDTCVLEVDDDEDAEAIALLVAGPPLPPKGFHVAATERVPGLCYCPTPSTCSGLSSSQNCQTPTCFACLRPAPVADPKAPLRVIRNLQMFSQIWRAKLSPPPTGSVIGSQHASAGLASATSGMNQMLGQGSSNPSLSLSPPSTFTLHFNRLLQSVFFKLRKMAPCALANLQFRVDLPEPEEVQLYVIGMTLGLGELLPRRQRTHTSGGNSRDTTRKGDDSEMIFSLEEEEEANMRNDHPPPETSTPKPTSMPSSKGWTPFMKGGAPTWAQWPLQGERHGIEVTPLSYIPGGRIKRYLGNLNFFFIRESTCIRESGGLSGFVHSFMTEVLCIVRAHARALGGNALVAFSIAECVLLHNPHKNQGQSLINVSGDVVYASYEQD